jgi:hypothetical protein
MGNRLGEPVWLLGIEVERDGGDVLLNIRAIVNDRFEMNRNPGADTPYSTTLVA